MKKVVLIDIDGVSCDHAEAICRFVNKDYDTAFTRDHVVKWDFSFGEIGFCDAVKKYYSKEDCVLGMSVMPGFKDFYLDIKDIFEVRFVTARKDYCHESTKRWIFNNFKSENVIFEKDKCKVQGDFLIDDTVDAVINAAKRGMSAFLLIQPWNKRDIRSDIIENDRVYVVDMFTEIQGVLKDLGVYRPC
ncbi:MAG: hypothetical protein K9L76_00655 [Candidatus Omnitrophica bacterium]|nr:hypothetical protein [Candidatus Omnitrophota bacterium]